MMQTATAQISPYSWPGIWTKKVKPVLTANIIIARACEDYDLHPDCMFQKVRTRKIVMVRQIAMSLIREFLKWIPLKVIGELFGGFDHTSVIHSIQTVKNLSEAYPEYKEKLDRLRESLKATYEIPAL